MLNAETLAGRFSMMPDPETVQYSSRAGDTWASSFEVPNCEKRPPTKKDIGVDSSFHVNTMKIWHIWTQNLAGAIPKTGDRITDSDEVVWTVEAASVELQGQRWRLTTNRG